MTSVAVLCSGGDAPGMNAAVRSLVRNGLQQGYQMLGVEDGYAGLIKGRMVALNSLSVADILNRGGAFLGSARSPEFMTPQGLHAAVANCHKHHIDVLVVIGGDGSYRGAATLVEQGIKVIGLPGTIDNDIGCTDYTIGFDTAVNTAVEAIYRLRDTSSSHHRASVVEVMGRHAGYIALYAGIAAGADMILLPEQPVAAEAVASELLRHQRAGKDHQLIVVGEGWGNSEELAKYLHQTTGIRINHDVLGHIQRGGEPLPMDRIHASCMAQYAIQLIAAGKLNELVGWRAGEYMSVPIAVGSAEIKPIPASMVDLAQVLSH